MYLSTYLDSVLPLREVSGTLLCLLEDLVLFRRGQTAADGAGLLRAEVERQVLLVLVEQAELRPLLKVDNGQGAGDRLAEVVAIFEERVTSASWSRNTSHKCTVCLSVLSQCR